MSHHPENGTMSDSTPSLDQPPKLVIAAIGDSETAGWNLPSAHDAFYARLEEKLKQDGYNIRVDNEGVSGNTSSQCLERIDAVIAKKPDIAVVEIGINDERRGVSPDKMQQNIDTILSRLKNAGIGIALVGQTPEPSWERFTQDDEKKHNLPQTDYSPEAYKAVFEQLAAKYNLSGDKAHTMFYPSYLDKAYGNKDRMQPKDDVHANRYGVDEIVKAVTPVVEHVINAKGMTAKK